VSKLPPVFTSGAPADALANGLPKERVVERGRGCWNCTGFENGLLARQQWRAVHRPARERQLQARKRELVERRQAELIRSPLAPTSDLDQAFNQLATQVGLLKDVDRAVTAGALGMCMVGGTACDFVTATFLCEKWTGRQGSSVATQGHPVDALPQELKDKLGDKD
jgi:hypothetical protein